MFQFIKNKEEKMSDKKLSINDLKIKLAPQTIRKFLIEIGVNSIFTEEGFEIIVNEMLPSYIDSITARVGDYDSKKWIERTYNWCFKDNKKYNVYKK